MRAANIVRTSGGQRTARPTEVCAGFHREMVSGVTPSSPRNHRPIPGRGAAIVLPLRCRSCRLVASMLQAPCKLRAGFPLPFARSLPGPMPKPRAIPRPPVLCPPASPPRCANAPTRAAASKKRCQLSLGNALFPSPFLSPQPSSLWAETTAAHRARASDIFTTSSAIPLQAPKRQPHKYAVEFRRQIAHMLHSFTN